MKSLALISCYFGKLPDYFQLFLKSCSWNPTIDWIIITDDKTPYQYTNNIKILYYSFNQIKERIESKIGLWAQLDTSYKLCDYKPAYGLLFEDLIKDYDFWGHCDIDVVWGNLRSFIDPLIERGYDRLFKYGHLTIYRNTDSMRRLFEAPFSRYSFRLIYSSKHSFGFDEMKGMWLLGQENKINQFHTTICYDIVRPSLSKKIRAYNIINYKYQGFFVEPNKVYRLFIDDNNHIQQEDMAYIHFQKRKICNPEILSKPYYTLLFTSKGFVVEDKSRLKELLEGNDDTPLSLLTHIKNMCDIYYHSLLVKITIFMSKL